MALFVLVFAMPNAAAQEGASVVILKFEQMDASAEIVRVLEASLAERIESHDDMYVKKGGEVTIGDLALTAGCDVSSIDCMKSLRDFVDADRVVFGSVQQSDNVYLFSMKMFDFAEGRYVAEMTDQTVEGDVSKVKKVIPALVDNFIYGDVGELVVEVTGADSPDLIFDGEKVGLAPTRLENLPLGEHVVTVKTAEGQEDTRTVVLRADEPVTVSFVFETETPVTTPDPKTDKSGDGPSAVPGWVSIGVGVAGLAVGGFGSFQVVQLENEFDDKVSPQIDPSTEAVRADADPASVEADADDIAQRAKTAEMMQWIGYGVGAVGLGVGTFFLIRAAGGGESNPSAQANRVEFGVAPTRGGLAASLQLRF
jgi:hypothetical protein